MKRKYIEPEFELFRVFFDDVCSVVHTSFEHGGKNPGWGFGDDDDDDSILGEG